MRNTKCGNYVAGLSNGYCSFYKELRECNEQNCMRINSEDIDFPVNINIGEMIDEINETAKAYKFNGLKKTKILKLECIHNDPNEESWEMCFQDGGTATAMTKLKSYLAQKKEGYLYAVDGKVYPRYEIKKVDLY